MARQRGSALSSDALDVWIDANLLNQPRLVGVLQHDRGHIRIRHNPAWLRDPARFMLDPDLSLDGQKVENRRPRSTVNAAVVSTGPGPGSCSRGEPQ